eukprot:jgi/Galph1/5259/GphlegSOOS_G3933.1
MLPRRLATWWFSNRDYLAKALKENNRPSFERGFRTLWFNQNAGLKEVIERSDHLYKLNDPTKGGSKYLQAKILSARVVLEDEARKRGETLPQERTHTQYHSS